MPLSVLLNVKMNVAKKRKNSQNNKRQNKSKTQIRKTKFESDIQWSTQDKKILLEALREHGSENISAISEMLPNISPSNIQSKIYEYSKLAEQHNLLNEWLDCGSYEPGDSLIPEALLFIQLFENHPPPTESGYDIRAIYNFLYRSCFEEPPFVDLSPENKSFLCSLLSNLDEKCWPKYEKQVWDHIGRVYNRRNIKKVYPGKNPCSL